MKIQTQAILTELQIDGQDILLEEGRTIRLEFSAIDTGGGFKDPMVDFSVSGSLIENQQHQRSEVMLTIADPEERKDKMTLSYKGEITVSENEVNGRITSEELPREIIQFVFQLVN